MGGGRVDSILGALAVHRQPGSSRCPALKLPLEGIAIHLQLLAMCPCLHLGCPGVHVAIPTWKLILFQEEMFRRALWAPRLMDGMEMLKSAVKPGGSDTPPGARGVGSGPDKIQPPELTLRWELRYSSSAGWLACEACTRARCVPATL